jgi:hypothetical protein
MLQVVHSVLLNHQLIQIGGITAFGGFIEVASGTEASLYQVASLGTVGPGFRNKTPVLKYLEELNNLPHDRQRILGQVGIILQKVDAPVSSGNLSLNDMIIEDNPLVRFNYFSAPEDLFTCIETAQVVLVTIFEFEYYEKFRLHRLP